MGRAPSYGRGIFRYPLQFEIRQIDFLVGDDFWCPCLYFKLEKWNLSQPSFPKGRGYVQRRNPSQPSFSKEGAKGKSKLSLRIFEL